MPITRIITNDNVVVPLDCFNTSVSVRVPACQKITYDCLTLSGTGCSIAVLYSYGNSGRQRVKTRCFADKPSRLADNRTRQQPGNMSTGRSNSCSICAKICIQRIMLSVRLSLCHKPLLYQNCLTYHRISFIT